jgi:hypothetical protein
MTAARSPRAEATTLLPASFEARVLEPSPPASTDPDWYADDPTDPNGVSETLVSPISGEGVSWTEFVGKHPHLIQYATDHWLGAYRRLQPLPDAYEQTRHALHQLAFFVLSPKRFAGNGKLGLRYTHRGFGTPFFGDDEQVRVERNQLVFQRGAEAHTSPITTLSSAAAFVGIPYRVAWFEGFRDPPEPVDPDVVLTVDPSVTDVIGDWFGFATSVLEQARRTPGAAEVSRVQLWPEHFDPAFEMGAGNGRASYGASPGDDAHPEPYLYVAAWGSIDRSDPYWNDAAFNGASLSYQEILVANDQRATALGFLHAGYERLTR